MPIRAARRWTRALLHRLQALSSRHYNFRYFMRVAAPDQIALLLVLSISRLKNKNDGFELGMEFDRLSGHAWHSATELPAGTWGLIRLGPQRLVELLWRYGYPDLAAQHKQHLQTLGLWRDDGH